MTTYDRFKFPAQLEEVIDGDTQDYTIDLGFHLRRQVRIRLAGIDTAEIYGVKEESAEHQLGDKQMKFVEEWLETAAEEWGQDEWPLIIETSDESGKYGRYIATVTRRSDGEELNSTIIEKWSETELETSQ